MHVAVVGGGLAGLSAAFFLTGRGDSVTLYQKPGNRSSASEIASGLLHPYPGPSGKKSKFADEAMKESLALIDKVEANEGETVSLRNGILRKGWKVPEGAVDIEETKEGCLITSGVTVYMPKYLRGLRRLMSNLTIVEEEVENLLELSDFDRIVVAAGGGVKKFFPDFNAKFVKGQILRARHDVLTYERSVIGKGHISPLEGGEVHIGSSYEHHYRSEEIEPEEAIMYLQPRIGKFFPPLEEFTILDCSAGIRVCMKQSYLPVIERVEKNTYLFTGLGSRGLLYHAYYGRLLAAMI